MKKLLRGSAILILVCILGIFILPDYAEAIIDAPDPPVEGLTTIKGIVKSPMPVEEVQSDGTIIVRTQKGLEGVTLSIYECANASPSCKKDGFLKYLFSSTSTNVNGEFYLYMRKRDGVDKLEKGEEQDDKQNESKRRYLVIGCGSDFAGTEIVQSWDDWDEFIIEANCPVTSVYEDPPATLKIYNDEREDKLAPHMGLPTDVSNKTLPLDSKISGSLNRFTVQAYNSIDPQRTEIIFDLQLKGADKRFAGPGSGGLIWDKADDLGHWSLPEHGARWDLDCREKYGDYGEGMNEGYYATVSREEIDYSKKVEMYDPEKRNIEKYCLSYGLDTTDPNDALLALDLVIEGGFVYGHINQKIINERPFGKIWTAGEFKSFWHNGVVSREDMIIIKKKLVYHHPLWVVEDFFSQIPWDEQLLLYRDIVPRQDITEVIQDPTDILRYNQLHYSNCVAELFLRYQLEEKADELPSCELYKWCNMAVVSRSNPYVSWYLDNKDAGAWYRSEDTLNEHRNSQTVSGPAQKLQSPSDIRFIYNYLSDVSTLVCKSEGGENIILADIQPPWDVGDGGNYKLDKSYFSSEFVMYMGENNRVTGVTHTEDARNDSYQPDRTNTDLIDKDVFRVLSGADLPLGGFMQQIPSGGYAANSSMKAVSKYTGGSSLNFADYFSPPSISKLEKRKIASQVSLLSLSGLPRISASLSNVNAEMGDLSLTPEQDAKNFQSIYYQGPPSHYPFSDLKEVSELTEEQQETLVITPEEDQYHGTRTAADAHYVTSPAYRRLVGLSENKDEGKERFAPIGHDFADSVLQTMSGKGDLTDLSSIDKTFLNAIYNYYKEHYAEPGLFSKLISLVLGFFRSIDKAVDENKSFFDRYDADEKLGNSPGFTDDLKVEFPLSERNFREEFPLPSPGKLTGQINLNTTIFNPYWLNPEAWGGNDCYPWDGVGFKGNCETAREEMKVSRTCRVDRCKEGSVGIMWTCNYLDEKAHDGHVTDILVKNTNCNEDMTQSNDRLVCAQKQFTCLLDLDGEGNLPANRKTGWRNSTIQSVESCIRWTAYVEEVDAAIREENAPKCPENIQAYPKDDYGYPLPLPMPDTLITPACLVSVAGPYVCDGDMEKDSNFMIEGGKVRKATEVEEVEVSDSYIADQTLRMNWQAPHDKSITAKVATFYTADTSVRPEDERPGISIAVDSLNPGMGGPKFTGAFMRSTFGPPMQEYPNAPLNPVNYHCNGELGGGGAWNCKIWPEPNPVEIDPDSLRVDGSCAVNPSPACAELIFKHLRETNEYTGEITYKDGVAPEFSETFLKVIGAAATQYNVPAAALLAYMGGEGTLGLYAEYYSVSMEEEFAQASLPWYGVVRNCNDVATSAQGPYNWLLKWFNFVWNNMEERGTLNAFAEHRGETASRCNFLDASFATALTLAGGPNQDSCGNWDWTRLSNALEGITFGTDPEGAHAGSHFEEGSIQETIFKTCRN